MEAVSELLKINNLWQSVNADISPDDIISLRKLTIKIYYFD
jgi:hypothetical protein